MFIRYGPDSYTYTVIEEVDLAPVFLALFENQVGRDEPLDEAVTAAEIDGHRVTRLIRTFEFENFVSIAGRRRYRRTRRRDRRGHPTRKAA